MHDLDRESCITYLHTSVPRRLQRDKTRCVAAIFTCSDNWIALFSTFTIVSNPFLMFDRPLAQLSNRIRTIFPIPDWFEYNGRYERMQIDVFEAADPRRWCPAEQETIGLSTALRSSAISNLVLWLRPDIQPICEMNLFRSSKLSERILDVVSQIQHTASITLKE